MCVGINKDQALAVVNCLWEEGYAFVSLNDSLVELIYQVKKEFKDFVQRRQEFGDVNNWGFQIPEEKEADVGLIDLLGSGKDQKWFFHQNPSLRESILKTKIIRPEDRYFLRLQQRLFAAACDLSSVIVKALDEQQGWGVYDSYKSCCSSIRPYSTSTLRSLYYPHNVENQKGAKAHFDRSFLTTHFGDEGGSLKVLADPERGTWKHVSPQLGQAVVFPGAKVLWPSKGRMKPVFHCSETEPGQDRLAFVFFGHIPIKDYLVDDADAAVKDFPLLLGRMQEGKYSWC